MTSAELDRLTTYVRDARTRTGRAASRLVWWKVQSTPTQHELRWLIGYEAGLFASSLLDAVDDIAALVTDPDQLQDLSDQAAKVRGAFRRSQLAAKLSQVEGRTPEEREAFLAKAKELAS